MTDIPTTPPGEPQIDLTSIIEPLKTVQSQTGLSLYTIFEDWIDLMLHSFCCAEEDYTALVDKYTSKYTEEEASTALEAYAEATGNCMAQCNLHETDILGCVYECLGLASDQFGQHFTPMNVAHAMAEMSFVASDTHDSESTSTDTETDTETQAATTQSERQRINVCDPACGSGRLLLAAAQESDSSHPMTFWGRDIDATVAKLAALNCLFYNIDAIIIHGNSLKMTAHTAWRIDSSVIGADIVQIEDPDNIPTPDGLNADSSTSGSDSSTTAACDDTSTTQDTESKQARDTTAENGPPDSTRLASERSSASSEPGEQTTLDDLF